MANNDEFDNIWTTLYKVTMRQIEGSSLIDSAQFFHAF